MATTGESVTPPPITAEVAVSPPSPESEDLAPTTNHPSDAPSPSQTLETVPPSPPLFLNSIGELKDLFAAISAFQQCYDDLHSHLHSIKAAILAMMPSEAAEITQPTASPSPKPNVVPDERVLEGQQEEQNAPESELVGLCKTMCSRGVRKYMTTHLSNLPMLREQVPKALREAPNSPKLVLECLGKFFLQGSRAFTKNSPMIPAREASILILECYLLMMGMDMEKDSGVLNIEKAVKEEADVAALAWRKRLVTEGGVAKASQIDARGLLLFIACFGIPSLFKVEDIRDLVIAANAKEIVGVLQKSHVLMSKISDIVEEMMKRKMEVDAVDIVYTFGLEERFNPHTILVSFLRESKETWKKSRKGSHGFASTLNEANKKQLAALKCISKCLARHKIDPAKFLPGWQINEKITSLEKDISNCDKKSGGHKRKSSETDTSQMPKIQEAKRSRYGGHGPQQLHKAADSRRKVMDNGLANHGPPVLYGGPGAGLMPESMIIPSVGGGISASHAGYLSSNYAGGGAHDGQLTNHGGTATRPYVWHRDPYSYNNVSHSQQPPSVGLTSLYSRGPSTSISMEGFSGNNASSLGLPTQVSAASDIYQFVDSVAESELYPTNVATPRPPTHHHHHHHPSYLYQV